MVEAMSRASSAKDLTRGNAENCAANVVPAPECESIVPSLRRHEEFVLLGAAFIAIKASFSNPNSSSPASRYSWTSAPSRLSTCCTLDSYSYSAHGSLVLKAKTSRPWPQFWKRWHIYKRSQGSIFTVWQWQTAARV